MVSKYEKEINEHKATIDRQAREMQGERIRLYL
jgi:hypothetical protein